MKRHLIAALCALTLPAAASAQDVRIDLDQTLVENFDGTAVADAAVPFSATATPRKLSDGSPAFDLVFPSGLKAVALPATCRDAATHTNCTGLKLSAFFDLPPGKTMAELSEMVNNFNSAQEAVQIAYGKDGKTRLTYYIVADFGITKTNLVIQIYNFRQAAQLWSRTLFPTPPAG